MVNEIGCMSVRKNLGLCPEGLSTSWCYIPTYYNVSEYTQLTIQVLSALKFKYRNIK